MTYEKIFGKRREMVKIKLKKFIPVPNEKLQIT